ncbi:tRNA (guanine(26)-N(2))-dimethyltransferase isoform X2 [Rhododendron vialii]|uniref:tRNA (guanine(26)-N(2))-dimethyltransferase isoform X2 n=1 Tax=Rhododendron vialii TaxID=182163 RepID=UPI0026602A9B|nr:tRNA (guanine(26)-N(2))-dimethyltransferase isoform X2 [Rhododendron vialii]
MTFLSPKTLPPSPFPLLPHKNPNPKPPYFHPHSLPTDTLCKSEYRTERGLEFDTGESFFRQESATGRDLGVLAASLHRKSNGGLRVLDAMCGCGIRSLRYLVEAEADFVLANDANEECRRVILSNMWRVPRRGGSGEEEKRWAVTHFDADRVMTEYYLQREYFDLIDVDSFGSDSSYFRPAINALKWGGLLYFTSTDGYTSGGNRPYHSVASYGAYVCRVPYSNEVGLRKVIGGAVREASVLGYHVTPLFSYYSFHGPVFRVMLRLSRGMLPDKRHYGFIGYCKRCGHSQAFSWDELGGIDCPCNKSNVSGSLVVLGPLWTGPLHTTTYITEMLNLAEQWGWTNSGMGLDLEKLLRQMIDESHPGLPPGYIIMDEVSKRAKVNSPRIKTMMSSIHQEGYVACRSHIASNALKTNCPMAECVRIAKELNSAE